MAQVKKVETRIRPHIQAFEHLGGVPGVIVLDSLKARVVDAAIGTNQDPTIHRTSRKLARHRAFPPIPRPFFDRFSRRFL